MDFGATLRAWRVEAELSQRELAKRVGIDFTYLSKIETGLVRPPSEEHIRAIANALGRSAADTEHLLSLARQSKVPAADINAVLIKHPEVGALLRRIKEKPLTSRESALIEKLARGEDPNSAYEEGAREASGT